MSDELAISRTVTAPLPVEASDLRAIHTALRRRRRDARLATAIAVLSFACAIAALAISLLSKGTP